MRIVQISGLVVFVLAVALTFIFTAGYQYDSRARDLVKKGGVHFEALPANAKLFLDGKAVEDLVPREIRVAPGPHIIEVRKEGFYTWTKHVTVPEDIVLRFPEIVVVPTATTPDTVGTVILPPNAALERSPHSAFSERGVFSVNNNLHYGLLHGFDHPYTPRVYELPLAAATLVDDPAIPMVALPDKVKRMVRFQKSGDYYLWFYESDKKDSRRNSIYAVTVTTHDGTPVLHQLSVRAASLENESIIYATDRGVTVYDLAAKKVISEYPHPKNITWLSRIKKSFQVILVTNGNVEVCDQDLENCHLLTTTRYGQLAASPSRDRFIVDHRNALILLDFAAPSLLPEFLQNLVSAAFSVSRSSPPSL